MEIAASAITGVKGATAISSEKGAITGMKVSASYREIHSLLPSLHLVSSKDGL